MESESFYMVLVMKLIETILEMSKLNGLDYRGIFTHFSAADELDKEYKTTSKKISIYCK